MSLRFRRSIKLIPGVRLNFSKSTIGLSVGVPGARVSLNSRGDIYSSAGIPGTGLYNVERGSLRGSRSSRRRAEAAQSAAGEMYLPSKPPKPGLFANRRERVFYAFLKKHFDGATPQLDSQIDQAIIDEALALAQATKKLHYTYLSIAFLVGARDEEKLPNILEVAADVWQNRARAFSIYEARKYFPQMRIKVEITPGISFDDIFGEGAFGFLYVEVLQAAKQVDRALQVLAEIGTNQLTAVSAADLELSEKRFHDVLDSTEDLELEDEATGMLFIMRAAALSELGFHDGALEAIKKVVAKRSLDEQVRNRALWERANIYERQGKRSLALKELEKIVLADSQYPQVLERIENLRKEKP